MIGSVQPSIVNNGRHSRGKHPDCVQTVIVGQLLRRQPWTSRHNFNEDIVKINSLLKEEMDNLDCAYFWPHLGFWADLSYLGRDGVHIERDSRHMKNICTVLELLFYSFQDKYVCAI